MRAIIATVFATLIATVLAGCAQPGYVAPDARIRPAPAWMTAPCPPLPAGPVNDGSPTVRAPYEGQLRSMYAECRERQAALASRDKILTSKH